MNGVTGCEAMISGRWYQDDGDLHEQRRRCARLLERFTTAAADDDAERAAVLRELLGSIRPSASVVPRFTCSYGDQISIGAGALVNDDCLLMDDAAITIGDNALVGRGPSCSRHATPSKTTTRAVTDGNAEATGWTSLRQGQARAARESARGGGVSGERTDPACCGGRERRNRDEARSRPRCLRGGPAAEPRGRPLPGRADRDGEDHARPGCRP